MREVLSVRTPENVTFEFELAGVPSRAVALAIDLVVIAGMIVVWAITMDQFGLLATGLGTALLFIVIFLMQWWYGALAEWWFAGQTVGKRIVGLRAIDERGLRLTFVQAVIRNLVRVADFLPNGYLLGAACAILDSRGRRLGDLAAGTVVVRERRAPAPAVIVPPSERHNTFIADPSIRIAARRITAPERDAMVALGLRRESLPLAIRLALFERLATHLEARLGVARPAYFSPEKYVLNLTAVVLSSSR